MVDLEAVGLADSMNRFKNMAYEERVVKKHRRKYLKHWLENEIVRWGQ